MSKRFLIMGLFYAIVLGAAVYIFNKSMRELMSPDQEIVSVDNTEVNTTTTTRIYNV